MAIIDILIKKIDALTKTVNQILMSSKKIEQLQTIEGESIFVVGSNGQQTGKVLLPANVDNSKHLEWHQALLNTDTPVEISKEKLSFDLIIAETNEFIGFKKIGDLPDGVFGNVRNDNSVKVKIRHNAVNVFGLDIPIFISNEMDYLIQPNEILNYKYSKARNQIEISVYDVSSFQKLIPKSEVFNLSLQELEQASVFLKLEEVPSVNEFTSIFMNGVFINPDDYLVEENNVIIAKSNIDYDIKVGMKITVNYKY